MGPSQILFFSLVLAVGAMRVVEMGISRRHQRALAEDGMKVLPEPLWKWMVTLHTGVLLAAAIEVLGLGRPFLPALGLPALALVMLANGLRLWVIRALGPHWNVRVVPSVRLGVVTTGPFRFIRHPNYVAVFLELTALPLVHGAYVTALGGAALHLLVLRRRIAVEEQVLLADPAYRAAMGAKPRFVPWPTR